MNVKTLARLSWFCKASQHSLWSLPRYFCSPILNCTGLQWRQKWLPPHPACSRLLPATSPERGTFIPFPWVKHVASQLGYSIQQRPMSTKVDIESRASMEGSHPTLSSPRHSSYLLSPYPPFTSSLPTPCLHQPFHCLAVRITAEQQSSSTCLALAQHQPVLG